jgi:hypothetical protein
MKDKIHQFASKYEAVCKPSGQYWRRAQPVPFQLGANFDAVPDSGISYQSVPMVEIHLPEDRFRALIEHDAFLDKYNHLRDSTTGSVFHDRLTQVRAIMDEHETECRIRNQHAAVQAAYEQYQTLLNLCR